MPILQPQPQPHGTLTAPNLPTSQLSLWEHCPAGQISFLEQNCYNFRFAIKERNWPFCHIQQQWNHRFSMHYSYVNNMSTNSLGISCQMSFTWWSKLQTTNYHNNITFWNAHQWANKFTAKVRIPRLLV